jgi:hypothetical protein
MLKIFSEFDPDFKRCAIGLVLCGNLYLVGKLGLIGLVGEGMAYSAIAHGAVRNDGDFFKGLNMTFHAIFCRGGSLMIL